MGRRKSPRRRKTSPARRIILLLQADREISRGLLRGIAHYTRQAGPWSFFRQPYSYQESGRSLDLKKLRDWKPDGAICPMEHVPRLSGLGIPMIAYNINHDYAGPVPCVKTDNNTAGILAAKHLLQTGLRHFTFCGYRNMVWSRERLKGFTSKLESAGQTLSGSLELDYRHHHPVIKRQETIDWLASLPKPIGMLCANDDLAESIIESCRLAGFGVPNDLAIIGVDDDEFLTDLLNPPLSSVRLTFDRAGYQAAELLEALIDGKQSMAGQRIRARAALVTERQSTNVLMVRDREVARALAVMRENLTRQMQVEEIVSAVGISHRLLNERFQKELGCSILQQYTRFRMEHICRLLITSNLRINEIADRTGYHDERHFGRYFKRSMGITPLAYRRKYSKLNP